MNRGLVWKSQSFEQWWNSDPKQESHKLNRIQKVAYYINGSSYFNKATTFSSLEEYSIGSIQFNAGFSILGGWQKCPHQPKICSFPSNLEESTPPNLYTSPNKVQFLPLNNNLNVYNPIKTSFLAVVIAQGSTNLTSVCMLVQAKLCVHETMTLGANLHCLIYNLLIAIISPTYFDMG